MNAYLSGVFTYFENVLHPAASKSEVQKTKRRASKTVPQLQASPDCLNMRAVARKQDTVRLNPAP